MISSSLLAKCDCYPYGRRQFIGSVRLRIKRGARLAAHSSMKGFYLPKTRSGFQPSPYIFQQKPYAFNDCHGGKYIFDFCALRFEFLSFCVHGLFPLTVIFIVTP
jgi:hypothetical protein